ncbi:MAG: thioesterase family protein [Hyphomicrobiales bacterium]|nr:thioesterase family protein [Hyphomicrobiales bacterium]
MTQIFEHHTDVGWFDLDANRHMKNTAYMEKAVDCRLRFFNASGVSPDVFAKWKVAFVVVRDETTYSRELFLGDKMRVQILCGGVNEKRSRFLIVNRILTPGGEQVYEIRSMVVWLNTETRKSTTPPPDLSALIENMARTEDYRSL